MARAFVIAIDGPAASGKGTLARRLAAHFGLTYLDTGALYRAVGRDVLAQGAAPEDAAAATRAAEAIDAKSLDDPRLRDEDVAQAASIVSAHPAVRTALLGFQRSVANRFPGAVLDGRDIGTIVCPDAQVKLFVTASPETRAQRRFDELRARGGLVAFDAVLADIRTRDARDAGRAAAPLRQAADALLLDTSRIGIEDAFRASLALVAQRREAVS